MWIDVMDGGGLNGILMSNYVGKDGGQNWENSQYIQTDEFVVKWYEIWCQID